MEKVFIFLYVICILSGCASHKYGYSKEEWKGLSSQQREGVEKIVKENIKDMKEKQHNMDMRNKKLNDLVGSRSNVYFTSKQ